MLKIRQVSQSFGKKVILDKVSFTANKGEIIGVVAPNGTGKTTLLNIIMNFLKPDNGHVELEDGTNYKSKKNEIKMHQHISFLPELDDLYGELTGLEHLKFYARLWNHSTEKVKSIIDQLKMGHYVKNQVQTYSLGMRQRLCFAMLLAADTEVLLMDEVMNGLDPDNVALLTGILIELKKQGKTILIASHLLDNLDLYADRVLFLKDGKIILEKKESSVDPREDLYLKTSISKDDYERLKENNSFPEGTKYLANKRLILPISKLTEDEVGKWVSFFISKGYTEVSIAEIGTGEWYEEFYNI